MQLKSRKRQRQYFIKKAIVKRRKFRRSAKTIFTSLDFVSVDMVNVMLVGELIRLACLMPIVQTVRA